MNLSRAWAGVVFLLFALLLTGAASALPGDENSLIMDPPPQHVGERIAVFLVLNEQPQQFLSFDQFKADAQSRQAQVLQSVRAVDTDAFKSAQSYWIANAIRVEADPATLDQLAAIPGVNHIEPDLAVTINDPVVEVTSTINPDSIKQTKSGYATVWSTDFIEAPSVWESGNNGSGVTIAVIDTGIDASHPAFGGRVTKFVDLVKGDNETSYDDHGHGTHCAGTAAGGAVTIRINDADIDVTLGVAPGADLMGVKVLNDAGSGNFSCILDGVQWAVENGADVLSMSLGVLQYTGNSSEGHISLDAHESHVVSLEVSSEDYGDTANLYEPQFVIAEVEYSDPYGSMNPLENLTFSVTDADGNPADGGDVDWLGFDQQANCYYFKAPYTSNRNAWNGIWKINVTNTGDVPVTIDRIALTESYQSCGNTVLDTAVNNVVAGGKVVVVSAGNSGWYGTSTIGTPGTARDVITVGATDYMMDYRASFSSMGPVNRTAPYVKPDLMAPGVGVISAYRGGEYAIMDGTSMACPAVAGTAALMLAGNSSLDPVEIKDSLMETAVHISENGAIPTDMWPNNAYGAGRVNAYEAVNVTGGLGGVVPSDGILRELIGGPLTTYYISGDTLPIMAVLWNTTAGEPIAGEDLELSVWYNDYKGNVYLENRTLLRTDENGYVYHSVNIADVQVSSTVYTQITYGDLRLSDEVWKQQATPASGSVDVPIFDAEFYVVRPNAVVEIKYPLLDADGSPYSESVRFTVSNSTDDIVDVELLPEDGVIDYSLNLTGRPASETYLNLYINNRSAGVIQVVKEPYIYQEIIPFPDRAICPPGKSVDVGFTCWSHGMRTISQDVVVYVTTLTETQVLSLSPAGAMALSTQDESDMQALLAEIDAMNPETYTTEVKIRNGIGILNFTMPEDGYIGVVRFVHPEGGAGGTVIIYGTLDPWLMHRSTPPVYVSERYYEDMDLSFIGSTYDWPATWDQDAYASVPSTEALITAYVYTCDRDTCTPVLVPGRTVYLYTADGAETNVTGENGTCTFSVDTSGKTEVDYILITEGVSPDWTLYVNYLPMPSSSWSSISPGMLVNEFGAASEIGVLYPDVEERSVSVVPDGDNYIVTARSYGPSDEPIHEKGYFKLSRYGENTIWSYEATEAAAVVSFNGMESRRLTTPQMEGSYEVEYGFMNPNSRSFTTSSASMRVPYESVSYTLPESVVVGGPTSVTFTVSTQNGTPVQGARIVLALGAAGELGWPIGYDDPRDANTLLAVDGYPDPYSEIATGYTDGSGKVTLTFTAPSAAQQALRESLAHGSSIPCMVLCYHGGDLIEEAHYSLDLTTRFLPDFVPHIVAPQVVKLERNDSITITDVALRIENIGTADYVYNESQKIACNASVGSYSEVTYFTKSLAMGETKEVLKVTVTCNARDFGIDTSDYRLPVDVKVDVEVNSNKAVEELNYQNNKQVYPVRITAPDLAVEVIAPAYTTPGGETAIGVRVKNLGEVGSNTAYLTYSITGKPEEGGISIQALGPGESTTVWRNQTLVAGDYTVTAGVNRDSATDYETNFSNNNASARVISSDHPLSRIELPTNLVLVPGTTYDLPITVQNVENLAAYNIDLTFNGSVVSVTNVTPGPLGIIAKNIESGRVRFEGAVASGGFSGDITLGIIRFNVTGKIGDTTDLKVSAGLSDGNGLPIPVDVVNGRADVLLYGDANGDGRVDQADTLKVLRQVVGLESKPSAGGMMFRVTDVTRNGVIDAGDAMFIAQYNVGLRDEYFRLK